MLLWAAAKHQENYALLNSSEELPAWHAAWAQCLLQNHHPEPPDQRPLVRLWMHPLYSHAENLLCWVFYNARCTAHRIVLVSVGAAGVDWACYKGKTGAPVGRAHELGQCEPFLEGRPREAMVRQSSFQTPLTSRGSKACFVCNWKHDSHHSVFFTWSICPECCGVHGCF